MIWLAFLVVLQVADVWSTLLILKRGGRELNPVMAKLMEVAGPVYALVLTKILLILGVYVSGSAVAVQVLCAVYAVVLAFNLRSLIK